MIASSTEVVDSCKFSAQRQRLKRREPMNLSDGWINDVTLVLAKRVDLQLFYSGMFM